MLEEPRIAHRTFAWLAGFFWLPCPLCGEYFGGHEYSSGTLWHDEPDEDGNKTGSTVCGNHDDDDRIDHERAGQVDVNADGGWRSIQRAAV